MQDHVGRTRFPSKRDLWLTALIWAGVVPCLGASLVLAAAPGSPGVRALILALLGTTAALMLWVLYGTHYTFAGEDLRIRSGPFRFTVPLAEITSVEPCRNPLSSPALSLDRLLIRYGRRSILVSPEPRLEFLDMLCARATGLVRRGDRVVRADSPLAVAPGSGHHQLDNP